ncbi:hypothetical protein CQA42_00890 [Helicobacter sp. MIT 99-5507]|nr:hypothetical protein CQA42_00890 [Helicobacter sp. MIT 99-5507]
MKYNKFFSYFSIFISIFLIFITFWVVETYHNNATLNAIIFHLTMPLDGINPIFYKRFILYCLLPSIFVLICSIYFFTPTIILCIILSITIIIFGFDNIIAMFKTIEVIYYKSFLFSDDFIFSYLIKLTIFILVLGMIIYMIYKISSHIKEIKKYYAYIFCILALYCVNKHFNTIGFFTKEYSLLYEQHYKIPSDLQSNKPRNLILILAESMESTYADEWERAKGEKNLIPNLYNIALKNIYFSNNKNFGGIYQVNNTSWTIAGTISYLCGVPLSLPIDSSVIFGDRYINRTEFLPHLTCISDILKQNNYNQMAFIGYESSFAGSKYFFASHNIDILDEGYFKKYGEIKYGYWGIKDSLIFKFAKQYLKDYKSNKPFVLYIPTVDTHYPGGFTDKQYCGNLDNNLTDAIKCSDKIINDFISWVKKQDFYNDTTIIILGDHLSAFSYNYKNRNIYNAFINAKFSTTPSKDLLINRKLSHFDITPLILDSIGFKVESFGLGRNPLYGKTLLEEYGLDEINKLITLDSKVYESFL